VMEQPVRRGIFMWQSRRESRAVGTWRRRSCRDIEHVVLARESSGRRMRWCMPVSTGIHSVWRRQQSSRVTLALGGYF